MCTHYYMSVLNFIITSIPKSPRASITSNIVWSHVPFLSSYVEVHPHLLQLVLVDFTIVILVSVLFLSYRFSVYFVHQLTESFYPFNIAPYLDVLDAEMCFTKE